MKKANIIPLLRTLSPSDFNSPEYIKWEKQLRKWMKVYIAAKEKEEKNNALQRDQYRLMA